MTARQVYQATHQVQDSSVGDAKAAERAARGQHLAVVQELEAGPRHRLDAAHRLRVLRQTPRCKVAAVEKE